MLRFCFGSVALGALLATPALAEDPPLAAPQVYNDVIACRAITDNAARLACFDQSVATLQTATDQESIVVVDRAEVREAERGLFGLRLPSIRLFGGGDENRVDQIESTLTAVDGGTRSRPWRFRLADGSGWVQTDTEQMSRPPRVGHTIIIERAALGSYRAEIDGMRKIRVQRVE